MWQQPDIKTCGFLYRETLRPIVNILACMLGGARHDGVNIADATLGDFTGQPQSTLIGRGRKTDRSMPP